RLRLAALFRLPYYLILALFFLYPLALAPLSRDPHSEALMWGLWGFSPAAGLLFLTLLPAVRRGHDYTRDNGSPWPWPYYPWSVFVFLAVAVVGRSFLLCWSFHLLDGGSQQLVFGPYFLVPFGLSLAALVLELGLVAKNRTTLWVALAAPAGLLVLAGVGHSGDPIYAEFLGHFTARLGGTPLFLTLLASAAFYLYAWARRVPLALGGLAAGRAALAVVGRETRALAALSAPTPAPVLAAAAFELWLGLWRRDTWRFAAGGAVVVGALAIATGRVYARLRDEVAGLDYLVL